jgi:hypothetical protein
MYKFDVGSAGVDSNKLVEDLSYLTPDGISREESGKPFYDSIPAEIIGGFFIAWTMKDVLQLAKQGSSEKKNIIAGIVGGISGC